MSESQGEARPSSQGPTHLKEQGSVHKESNANTSLVPAMEQSELKAERPKTKTPEKSGAASPRRKVDATLGPTEAKMAELIGTDGDANPDNAFKAITGMKPEGSESQNIQAKATPNEREKEVGEGNMEAQIGKEVEELKTNLADFEKTVDELPEDVETAPTEKRIKIMEKIRNRTLVLGSGLGVSLGISGSSLAVGGGVYGAALLNAEMIGAALGIGGGTALLGFALLEGSGRVSRKLTEKIRKMSEQNERLGKK